MRSFIVGSCHAGVYAGYTTGEGFSLASNYTTDAVTVAGVAGLCQSGAPQIPVLEATIGTVHKASPVLCPRGVSQYCILQLSRGQVKAAREVASAGQKGQ